MNGCVRGPGFKERLEAILKWPNCLYNQTTRELRRAIIHTFTKILFVNSNVLENIKQDVYVHCSMYKS